MVVFCRRAHRRVLSSCVVYGVLTEQDLFVVVGGKIVFNTLVLLWLAVVGAKFHGFAMVTEGAFCLAFAWFFPLGGVRFVMCLLRSSVVCVGVLFLAKSRVCGCSSLYIFFLDRVDGDVDG